MQIEKKKMRQKEQFPAGVKMKPTKKKKESFGKSSGCPR